MMATLDLMWEIKGRIRELPESMHRGYSGHTGEVSGDRQSSAILTVPRHRVLTFLLWLLHITQTAIKGLLPFIP